MPDDQPTLDAQDLSHLRTTRSQLGTTPFDGTPLAGAEPTELVGQPPRFSGLVQIARGGMGAIYRAHDEATGRDVALKVVLPGRAAEQALRKFVSEARITARLEHPCIVPVHDLTRAEDGTVFFTMKLVEGESLGQLLERWGDAPSMTWSHHRLLEVFIKICDAMAHAHSRGVIHRDLKPANVMVGEFGEVLVMDWGLAKVLGTAELPMIETEEVALAAAPEQTQDGTVMGTPGYMAPEQARGEVERLDARTDIYALGALLYGMLTLTPPFRGATAYVIVEANARGDVEPPSRRAPERHIPHELEAVVLKAMALAPADRYACVPELRDDLVAYLDGRLLRAAHYTVAQRLAKLLRRHRAATAAVLVAILLGASFEIRTRAARAEATARASAESAAEARRRTRAFSARLGAARAVADRAEALAAALCGPDAPALRMPNGERAQAAIEAYFDAHLAALDALGALAALGSDAPDAAAHDALVATWVDTRRQAVALAAARVATDLGDGVLARLFVDRARAAGLAEHAATHELATFARRRRERIEEGLAMARAALERARGRGASAIGRVVDRATMLRVGGPDLVRLLLQRRYIDSAHEFERRLAIEVLGLIGDTRTRGPEGLDPVEALSDRLARVDLTKDRETAVALIDALGLLGDSRASERIRRRRIEAGEHSAFWQRTVPAVRRIQLAIALRAQTPTDVAGLIERAKRWVDAGRNREALADLARAVALDPRHVRARAIRGGVLMRSGDHAGALTELGRAIALDPKDVMARINRGMTYFALGDPGKAMPDLDAAVALAPDAIAARLSRARALGALSQRARALADLAVVLRLDPRNITAHLLEGMCHLNEMQHGRALRAYEAAARVSPRNAAAHFGMGRALTMLQRYDDAIASFNKALRLRPAWARAYHHRGLTRQCQEQLDLALDDADRAVELAPEQPIYRAWRGDLRHKLGRYAEALADMDAAIRMAPDEAGSYIRRAVARRRSGDVRGARADLIVAAKLDPKTAEPLFYLGVYEVEARRFAAAIPYLDRALQLDPKHERALAYRGWCHVRLRRVAQGNKDFDRSLALDAGGGMAYYFRGRHRLLRQQLELAEADLTKAIATKGRLAGWLADAYYQRAQARQLRFNLDGALADMRHAMAVDPKHVRSLVGAATLLRIRGKLPEAKALLRRAIPLVAPDQRHILEKLLAQWGG